MLKSATQTAIFKFLFILTDVNEVCLHVCKCITCVPGACADQKRASELLKVELQATVNYYASAGNQTGVRCRAEVLLTTKPSLQTSPMAILKLIIGIQYDRKIN